jgi:hypothetical protein
VAELVDDLERERPQKRKARAPGEGDLADGEVLGRLERQPPPFRLPLQLAALQQPDPGGNRPGGKRAREVAPGELRQLSRRAASRR